MPTNLSDWYNSLIEHLQSLKLAIQNYIPPGGGGGTGNFVKIPFSYGDASPVQINDVTGLVSTTTIIISTPFNGTGAALAVGDASNNQRLMAFNQILPDIAAEWSTNPGHLYAVATPVLLTIVPGSGASQGSGYLILEVV